MAEKVDCKSAIRALMEAGMSQKEIAVRCGCSQPYISMIANGTRGWKPGFLIGARLMLLFRELKVARAIELKNQRKKARP